MKKSILILFLSVFCQGVIHAQEWTMENGTLIISGTWMRDYTSNNQPWNDLRSGIRKVVIKEGVKNIGAQAFYYCSNLTSVTIPNTVTKIGIGAFKGCNALTTIDIPNSVTEIGGNAFENCQHLTSITIPNSVTKLGGYVFHYCFNLTSVTLSNSITKIEEKTFQTCTSLASVNIPNSVTSIGNQAFSGCSSLPAITIPKSVTSIGGEAFGGCKSLATIICYATTPPLPSNNSKNWFTFVPTPTGTLYVPASSISAYKATDEWKHWQNIKAIEDGISTGLDKITDDKADDDKIYNLNGQRINGLNAPKGIYIKNGKKYAR